MYRGVNDISDGRKQVDATDLDEVFSVNGVKNRAMSWLINDVPVIRNGGGGGNKTVAVITDVVQ